MVAPFDIFKIDEYGGVMWVDAVPDMDTAKVRLTAIGSSSPGTYMILSQATGNKLSVDVDSQGVLIAARASFTRI
jgi:hypothetical protein